MMNLPAGKQWISKNRERASILAVFLAALSVRLLGIAARPTWYDEAFSILFSEKGLKAMLAGTLAMGASGKAADVHPLAYYTLLGGWMKVFGKSLVSARMLSILLGMGIVLLAYLLLRRMFTDQRLVLVGTLGIALSPFLVHFSQEIRMYALLACALTGATLAFWQGLHSKKVYWWVLFAMCAALAQYTQNLAAFYLLPLALTTVFLRRWDKVKMTLLSGMGAILLYLPWVLVLPAQFATIQSAYWVEKPTVSSIFTTLLTYVTNLPVDERWLPLALGVTLIVIGLAAYQTFLALRRKLPGARGGLWLAYLAFTPPALAFVFSQWQPVYIERAFLPSGVMFWLWLVWALLDTHLPRLLKITCLTLLTAGIVLGLATHLTYAGFPYGPYAALDDALETRAQPGDVILHSNKLSLLPAIYFDRDLEQEFIADPPGSANDSLAPATQAVLGITESVSLESATGEAKRVWFIIFEKALDESAALGLEEHPDLAWLNSHFQLESMENWGELRLYVYKR